MRLLLCEPAVLEVTFLALYEFKIQKVSQGVPYGLVVRIRRSHRRGPGSIPGVGKYLDFFFLSLHLAVGVTNDPPTPMIN